MCFEVILSSNPHITYSISGKTEAQRGINKTNSRKITELEFELSSI